jgi:curli biogenesis system outer membrane secretion channel CsgG
MQGRLKFLWLIPFVLYSCGGVNYEKRVNLSPLSSVRSILVVPFMNYSGVPASEKEVNMVFVDTIKRYGGIKVLGEQDVYKLLRQKGIKKKPVFDRKMAFTLGRIMKTDVVVYGIILSYMKSGTVMGPDGYASLAMNVRVLNVRNGQVVRAYAVSKDVSPSLFSSLQTRFQKILNESISSMVEDMLGGGENW